MANYSKNKKYHYTYKTTNLINNRYYLGMHSTNRLDDGYLGSGKRLYYELNKYGRDNFKFEILKHFDSREELVQAEIALITEEDLKNTNCLNLKSGGSGGFSTENQIKGNKAAVKRLQKLRKDLYWLDDYRSSISEGVKRAWSNGYYSNRDSNTFEGKKHRPETIRKMKESAKGKGKGVNNSQYGTCWITDNIENKKIYKGDLIPEGWKLGRKITK